MNFKNQAKMMQQLGKIREELSNKTVEGSAGGGLVTVTLNGEKDLKKIVIKPEVVSDIEGLQDLILAAFADANKKLEEMENPLSGFSSLFG